MRYQVTCLKCKKSDIVTFADRDVVDYEGKFATPFLSFRYRPDNQWGFECKCGNDSRLLKEEMPDFNKLVQGDNPGIANILKNLEESPIKFEMVAV